MAYLLSSYLLDDFSKKNKRNIWEKQGFIFLTFLYKHNSNNKKRKNAYLLI